MKLETIEIKVIGIKWPKEGTENPYNNYIIQTDKGTVKGSMKWRPAENELLKLRGSYTEYKGMKQFSFKEATLNVPIDPRSQLTYVAERTRGIGEKKQEAIWELLGDDWKVLSDEDADKLSIRAVVLEEFRQQIKSLERDGAKAEAISYLISMGATSGMGATAWELWEKDTIGIVNADCYRLADLPNYGFKDVDGSIRKSYRITDDDQRRIKAAVIYSTKNLTSSGSTVISWYSLVKMLSSMNINLNLVTECVNEMFQDFTLKAFTSKQMLALGRHYNAEISILQFIRG